MKSPDEEPKSGDEEAMVDIGQLTTPVGQRIKSEDCRKISVLDLEPKWQQQMLTNKNVSTCPNRLLGNLISGII